MVNISFSTTRCSFVTSISLVICLGVSTAWAQTNVKSQPLRELLITVSRSVPAEVLSLRESTISSELTTTIVELPLLVGDRVTTGDMISRLDCTDNELGLQQSRADLGVLSANQLWARQQLDRLERLKRSNNASEDEINQKQSELNAVNAQIKSQNSAIGIAQRQVDKCQVRAPFSGVVTDIHSQVGSFVTSGSPIVSIIDTNNIELSARVSASEFDQAIQSDQLLFLYQQQTFPVSVRTTLGLIDPTSQTRLMRLNFTEKQPLPGSNGRLQWMLPGNILPASMIVSRDEESGIFIVDQDPDSKPSARFIALPGVKQGQPARVDLDLDTLVITDGRFGLTDGDLIVVE